MTHSWPPSASHQPPPYGGNGHGNGVIGEIRERVASLETHWEHGMRWAQDRVQAQADRLSQVDGRLNEGDRRMSDFGSRLQTLEERDKHTAKLEVEVKTLSERSMAQDQRRQANVTWIKYSLTAIVFFLTLTGKIDAEKALGLVMRILGIGV